MGKVIEMNNKKKENKPVKKRLGRFFISGAMVREHHGPMAETLAYIRFLPTNVYFKQDIDTFIYTGISTYFREIKLGEKLPDYELIVHNNQETGKFERVEALEKEEFLVNKPSETDD